MRQNVNRLGEKEKRRKNLTISSLKGERERRLHRWFGEKMYGAFSLLMRPLCRASRFPPFPSFDLPVHLTSFACTKMG